MRQSSFLITVTTITEISFCHICDKTVSEHAEVLLCILIVQCPRYIPVNIPLIAARLDISVWKVRGKDVNTFLIEQSDKMITVSAENLSMNLH